jgi:pimeloyl-ACP methyl ester carboxylesterase
MGSTPITVREYGTAGPLVAVLHGGPGAPGYMAPVARRLADQFRVVEPLQRGSGHGPLTVARHVEDLHDVLTSRSANERTALVGHSWGAMLALAYAAAHAKHVASVALIGCGTFDVQARDGFHAIVNARMDDDLRERVERLVIECPDPDERLRRRVELTLPLYSYAIDSSAAGFEGCDARAHQETWDDMMRLQAAGVYPQAFERIRVPVIMLHGAADPHPGPGIRESLEPYLPQLEYVEWEQCGHYPWLEGSVREEFFGVLAEWLRRHTDAPQEYRHC